MEGGQARKESTRVQRLTPPLCEVSASFASFYLTRNSSRVCAGTASCDRPLPAETIPIPAPVVAPTAAPAPPPSIPPTAEPPIAPTAPRRPRLAPVEEPPSRTSFVDRT